MISPYHQEVAEHYEKFPYPSYPIFSLASWKQLSSVDCSLWGAKREIRDIWIAGSGTIAPLMFGRRNFKANILASDLSTSALEGLEKRLRLFGVRNVHVRCEDIFEARYSGAFDAIDAYGVLHHTVSPAKALEILWKALRPGGVIRLMVYSAAGRARIETLRAEVRKQKLTSVENVKHWLREKAVDLTGDLSNPSGIADALLNPIVHTFNEDNLKTLLSSVPELEILRLETQGNFVAWGRRV